MTKPKLVEPKKLATMSATAAADAISSATEWFAQENATKVVIAGLPLTEKFLLANNACMDADGDIKDGRRWFDNSSYTKTDDWLLLNARKSALRRLAYGHGVMHLLKHLKTGGILGASTRAHWDRATDLAEYQATEVLLGKSLRNFDLASKDGYLNLDSMLPFFGYAGNDSAAVRNKCVVPMVTLGLWSASRDKTGYQVRIGPVGSLFFRSVFEPVVKAYDAVLDSENPSATKPKATPPDNNQNDTPPV